MARCSECKQLISRAEQKKQKTQYDEQGRIKSVMHRKCWYVVQKLQAPQRNMVNTGRITANTPTVYDPVRRNRDDVEREALAQRQKEIAEQRAEEEVPKDESDWRDPVTLDLTDLIEEVEADKEPERR